MIVNCSYSILSTQNIKFHWIDIKRHFCCQLNDTIEIDFFLGIKYVVFILNELTIENEDHIIFIPKTKEEINLYCIIQLATEMSLFSICQQTPA